MAQMLIVSFILLSAKHMPTVPSQRMRERSMGTAKLAVAPSTGDFTEQLGRESLIIKDSQHTQTFKTASSLREMIE